MRQLITSGQVRPGEFMPTERELAERFGAGQNTIKNATLDLVIAGLLERIPGRSGGMRVREHVVITHFASRSELPGSPFGESDTFFREVREQGFEPSQEFSVHIAEMTPELAQLLEADEGDIATVRRCLRLVNGVPHSIQESFYPQWLTNLVPELNSPRDIPVGTTQLLKDRGFEQIAAVDSDKSRMPTAEEESALMLTGVTPVLEWTRVGYTLDRAVRVSIHVMAGPSAMVKHAIGDSAALARVLDLQ